MAGVKGRSGRKPYVWWSTKVIKYIKLYDPTYEDLEMFRLLSREINKKNKIKCLANKKI